MSNEVKEADVAADNTRCLAVGSSMGISSLPEQKSPADRDDRGK